MQEKNYYPFGLEHKGYNDLIRGSDHQYDYLGKERQEDLEINWVSFRYRNGDPSTGRFFGIDPVSEEYFTISNYQFAHNNPVWKVELEGLEGASINVPDKINSEPVAKQGLEFKFTLGWGKTVGLDAEVLGVPISGMKDWGTSNTEISSLTGAEFSQTSGFNIESPIISYSKETKLIYSDPNKLTGSLKNTDNIKIEKGTKLEGKKETETKYGFMFGTGVETITENGQIVFNEDEEITVSTQRGGSTPGAFPGPFDLSFEKDKNSNSKKENNGEFTLLGATINTWVRIGFEVNYHTGESSNKNKRTTYVPVCFTEGTKIMLANGQTKKIENIKPKDLIKTYRGQ
ncbi:RHS repeat domain-containing protein [Aquimarina sp. MAR_2010_214]|uniref:RHS repeat domain-containing protein n=1 Tax=Aquimarina sp. MAR_2010_214 TaxID=1250026 RepID=UPI0013043011|nr:RHS repeat-associated core domain-containing protein [Aquimarina sp. MAR_2010_214]